MAEEIRSIGRTATVDQIINMAGFGIGIGSGRSSGYGRVHVSGIE